MTEKFDTIIEVFEINKDTLELENDTVVDFVDKVNLKVTHKGKEYYVHCSCLEAEKSDEYYIGVYDNEMGFDRFANYPRAEKHLIDCSYVYSDGSFVYSDDGSFVYDFLFKLKDEATLKEAIMEALFGDKGIIIPF